MNEEYYVYAWFFKSTGKVFHIGKGKGLRYKDTVHSRNIYFKNIINKYFDDVDVKKLIDGLTNEEACIWEKQLIKEYKEKGECETNFHEGGCGGNTGNYNSPNRHKKLSKAAKARIGCLNPNYGNHWTDEQKAILSEKIKKVWQETPEVFGEHKGVIPWNKGKKGLQVAWNAGQHLSEEHYKKIMLTNCQYKYEVYFNEQLVYWCLGHTKLYKFCEETFNISRTIIKQIIKGSWQPKFEKHKYLSSLKIIKIDRSVTTNCDECNSVEWSLQPFEVQGNQ